MLEINYVMVSEWSRFFWAFIFYSEWRVLFPTYWTLDINEAVKEECVYCVCLKDTGFHELIYLKVWSLLMGLFRKDWEEWSCWIKCVSGGVLKFSKAHTCQGLSMPPVACTSDVSWQILLQCYVYLPENSILSTTVKVNCNYLKL